MLNCQQKGRLAKYYAKLGMKPCWKCMSVKGVEEFNKSSSSGCGLNSRCRACDNNASALRRAAPGMAEKASAYHEKWAKENMDKIKENTKSYAERNPEKRKAYSELWAAISSNKIVKPTECEECGGHGLIDGHHDDYNKPLVVRWLCRSCHKAHHKNERSTTNA